MDFTKKRFVEILSNPKHRQDFSTFCYNNANPKYHAHMKFLESFIELERIWNRLTGIDLNSDGTEFLQLIIPSARQESNLRNLRSCLEMPERLILPCMKLYSTHMGENCDFPIDTPQIEKSLIKTCLLNALHGHLDFFPVDIFDKVAFSILNWLFHTAFAEWCFNRTSKIEVQSNQYQNDLFNQLQKDILDKKQLRYHHHNDYLLYQFKRIHHQQSHLEDLSSIYSSY